jgi:5-exo-hydroxycamphor dehydrogenase
MRDGKVVVFDKPGIPLRIRVEETPDPAENEFVVRMEMAGICGSDVHRLAGHVPIQPYPICFGHEGVGTIVTLGSGISTDRMGAPLAVGDRVYWAPSTPCQICEACKRGNQMMCKSLNWPVRANGPNAAAFRELATLNTKHVFVRVLEGTSLESVIAFGCAMPTALRAFERLGKVDAELDSTLVVQGSGPVGLALTLLGSLAGIKNVVIIGDPEPRLEVARRLGATEVMSVSGTTIEQRKERILELTNRRGADIVAEAAGHPSAFPEGFELLGMNGRYLIVGLWSGTGTAVIDPIRINNLNLQIIGSLGIDPKHYQQTVEIATKYGATYEFDKMISHFKLDNLEEAIRAVGLGDSIKTVVVP